ncbi:hypothetical protein Pth03_58700 [Planotetraspora thailandica]|uniref:Hemerythrin-like domain-containing protein n=1 Tax=Planotetraspora thailandica TaxID=487172 RepID=A0A8J3V9M0_9ACTN|nr:hemerythrin domain-containing protein [Planotetraspora thailandica]GII57481.1 hypothetical protein Pth03_58700 [Planotetraspora thailandica]
MQQNFDAREMEMLHKMFRREFSLAPGLVRRVEHGDQERTEVVAWHLTFILTALHNHHHFEDDEVWPFLLERGSDAISPHVRHVQEQHEGIESATSEMTDAVAAWKRDATAESGEVLARAVDRLVPLLLQHMAYEEQYVVPVMEKHISRAEWNLMIQAGAANLVPEDMPLEFGMMMYEGDPEIVADAISKMPEELSSVISAMAREAYAVHAERIHGTTNPPRSTDVA